MKSKISDQKSHARVPLINGTRITLHLEKYKKHLLSQDFVNKKRAQECTHSKVHPFPKNYVFRSLLIYNLGITHYCNYMYEYLFSENIPEDVIHWIHVILFIVHHATLQPDYQEI